MGTHRFAAVSRRDPKTLWRHLGLFFFFVTLWACGGSQQPIVVEFGAAEDEPNIGAHAEHNEPTIDNTRGDETPSDGRYTVQFDGRVVDLEPFVQGFPYRSFQVDFEHSLVLYFHTTPEGTFLLSQPLPADGPLDVLAGERVIEIDWSERSYWYAEPIENGAALLIMADEANEERMNVYRLDRATRSMERLTDNDYTYGFGLNAARDTFVYVARNGVSEPFNSCLRVHHLATGDDEEILCDHGGVDRFTWTSIVFSESEDEVFVRIQHDGDRNTTNIARIRLEPGSEWTFLLERGVAHYRLGVMDRSVTEDALLFASAQDGYTNIFRHHFADGTSQALTAFTDEVRSAHFVDTTTPIIAVALQRPHESELLLLDGVDGTVRYQEVVPTLSSISEPFGDLATLSSTATDTPFSLDRLHIVHQGDAVSLERSPFAGVPASIREAIIHCEPRRVSIPTFDTLEDGTPRLLHAYYLQPRAPAADPSRRLVSIIAFYGGGNAFSQQSHILCAAGVAVLSPAVRGSSGFGADFAALNDGDLGGDEIVDLFYAARWLVENEGYMPHQIGVHGGSHGGYATMRALTFPPETNGHNDSFPFGFGMSHAGFSNILTFFETCNIPDWVILEAGDPATEAEKLLDRSPITHIDRLDAPLLLTHGSNDQRVPVEESRQFAAAAGVMTDAVVYVEFEGQGHGISGLQNTLHYYATVFAFLEQVLQEHDGRGP